MSDLTVIITFRRLQFLPKQPIILHRRTADVLRIEDGPAAGADAAYVRRRKKNTMNEAENMKMLQSTIEESDALAANTDNRENEIVVSASEDETKLFWSIEYSEQLSA